MPEANFTKCVQDTLVARVVLRRGKFTHITSALSELNSSASVVHQRVVYKLATLTYKIKHNSQPEYLSELIVN